jgi:hypothetical protein
MPRASMPPVRPESEPANDYQLEQTRVRTGRSATAAVARGLRGIVVVVLVLTSLCLFVVVASLLGLL